MTGGLQPDLLDLHARFYVEAKQYKNSAHSYIVKPGVQILDTVGKLRGDRSATSRQRCRPKRCASTWS